VFPALRKLLEDWNPLAQPATGAEVFTFFLFLFYCLLNSCFPPTVFVVVPLCGVAYCALQLVSRWRYILARARTADDEQHPLFDTHTLTGADSALATSNIYTQLIVSTVLPRVRLTFTNEWDARDWQRPMRFLDVWHRLLPPAVLENVYGQLVMPRLAQAVETWNPRTDAVPIHSWLLPWLPHLGTVASLIFRVRCLIFCFACSALCSYRSRRCLSSDVQVRGWRSCGPPCGTSWPLHSWSGTRATRPRTTCSCHSARYVSFFDSPFLHLWRLRSRLSFSCRCPDVFI
jgi:hypothetical protein